MNLDDRTPTVKQREVIRKFSQDKGLDFVGGFFGEVVYEGETRFIKFNPERKAWKTEYQALELVGHLDTIPSLHYKECLEDGLGVLVTDKCEGFHIFDDYKPVEDAVDQFITIGKTLKYCHTRGLIHSDICSDNIFFGEQPMLTDFDTAEFDFGSKKSDFRCLFHLFASHMNLMKGMCGGGVKGMSIVSRAGKMSSNSNWRSFYDFRESIESFRQEYAQIFEMYTLEADL